MGGLTAMDAQNVARETQRQLTEARHTLAGLEALLAPVAAAVADGWGGISVTGHRGERVILFQLERHLLDLIEAAEAEEHRSRRAGRNLGAW